MLVILAIVRANMFGLKNEAHLKSECKYCILIKRSSLTRLKKSLWSTVRTLAEFWGGWNERARISGFSVSNFLAALIFCHLTNVAHL